MERASGASAGAARLHAFAGPRPRSCRWTVGGTGCRARHLIDAQSWSLQVMALPLAFTWTCYLHSFMRSAAPGRLNLLKS